MKLQLTLEPIYTGTLSGKRYYEQILVRVKAENNSPIQEPYPSFMCHIDTFWDGDKDSPLYKELEQGNRVKATCEIEMMK